MTDHAPTVVGGYQLVGRVGSGSTASVWKATDPALGRAVALKQVAADAAGALRAEASRLAQLDDPHVVQVYGFVEEADAAYLVEEWIDGATLAEVLASGGKLSVPQALGVVRGSLLGLAHAHARGIVHGDVSSSNILVDTGGTSRLIDFGVGGSTPAYRSPEATGGGPLSPRSDVYAAAAVLAHLLTGQTAADTAPDVGKIDAGLRPVLRVALAPDPAARYVDAAAFLEALEDAAGRAYGATWWTTAGVGALVAPAVAAVVVLGAGGAVTAVGSAGSGVAATAKGTGFLGSKAFLGGASAAGVAAAGTVAFVALQGDPAPAPEPEVALVGFRADDGVCEAIEPSVRDLLGNVRYRVDAAPGEAYTGDPSNPIRAVGRECDYGSLADPFDLNDPGSLVAINVATDQQSYNTNTVHADPSFVQQKLDPTGSGDVSCSEADAAGLDSAVACSVAAGLKTWVVFVADLGDQNAVKCSYEAPDGSSAGRAAAVADGAEMCGAVVDEIGIYR